jgi:hypothetical protein
LKVSPATDYLYEVKRQPRANLLRFAAIGFAPLPQGAMTEGHSPQNALT